MRSVGGIIGGIVVLGLIGSRIYRGVMPETIGEGTEQVSSDEIFYYEWEMVRGGKVDFTVEESNGRAVRVMLMTGANAQALEQTWAAAEQLSQEEFEQRMDAIEYHLNEVHDDGRATGSTYCSPGAYQFWVLDGSEAGDQDLAISYELTTD